MYYLELEMDFKDLKKKNFIAAFKFIVFSSQLPWLKAFPFSLAILTSGVKHLLSFLFHNTKKPCLGTSLVVEYSAAIFLWVPDFTGNLI